MSRILITGGAGFLASSLADHLLKADGNMLVLVDNLLTGDVRKVPVHENCHFIKGDVNDFGDISAVMTRYAFDYVFHYAAVVGVKRTLDNPVSVLRDIHGVENILDLCKNTGVKRVFYTSSSEVYGEPVELPQNEDTTPLNSRLPYAVVKNLGEAFCRSYHREYSLDYTIVRFFNTYGAKQSPDFVISKFLKSALLNEPITIYGDGKQTRTFCFVDDNVEAVVGCLTGSLFVNDVVNIGNDMNYTILELAEIILKVTKSKSAIKFLPPLKEGDMTRRQPDISKMRQVLRREFVSLENGIRAILQNPIFGELNALK
jgi:UDP-glucose 4-epimerase